MINNHSNIQNVVGYEYFYYVFYSVKIPPFQKKFYLESIYKPKKTGEIKKKMLATFFK